MLTRQADLFAVVALWLRKEGVDLRQTVCSLRLTPQPVQQMVPNTTWPPEGAGRDVCTQRMRTIQGRCRGQGWAGRDTKEL